MRIVLVSLSLGLLTAACESGTDPDQPVCADLQIESTNTNPYTDETSTVGATAVTSTGVPVQGVAIFFTSSQPAVAEVDRNTGRVLPKNPGTTQITANAPCGPGGAMVTRSITITVRPAASRFDGNWTGNYSGNISGPGYNGPISGGVEFTVRNGNITMTAPTAGTGVIASNGSTSFAGSLNGGSCTWTGTFASNTYSSGGTWACSGQVSGGGSWTAREKGRAP